MHENITLSSIMAKDMLLDNDSYINTMQKVGVEKVKIILTLLHKNEDPILRDFDSVTESGFATLDNKVCGNVSGDRQTNYFVASYFGMLMYLNSKGGVCLS